MRAVIVEDEVNVREGFIKMLKTFCPEVKVLSTADSVESAKLMIENTDFDLLFLDVNLPDGTGFDLLDILEAYNFLIIFVTAYSQYAISAFKMSAVDYLLKPVSPTLLQDAINKAKNGIEKQNREGLKILKNNLNEFDIKKKIVLKDLNNIHLVELDKIIYCHADGSYTKFLIENESEIITSINLKEYEEMLATYDFIRCHHSYLVNLNHIARISKTDGATLVLSNGNEVPVSKRKKSIILNKINDKFIN